MPTYVNPFTGQTIQPSQVGYESLTISTNTPLQWPVNGNDNLVVANIIEVTASTVGLELQMPSATQVSDGQSVLIKNVGANTFTVVDYDGGTIIAQAVVPVHDTDTVDVLSARILEQEHRLYPAAIATVLAGGWRIDGRRFVAAPERASDRTRGL